MKYNGVIQRKLARLDEVVTRLETRTSGMSFEVFVEDWVVQSMVERSLQVAAEIMIDVAERIIALENAGPVAGATGAIDRLVDLGVLVSPEPYKSIVRMRNRLVHEYDETDPRILYSVITSNLDDFRRFRDEIDAVE